jgi:dihydropteroate synthase
VGIPHLSAHQRKIPIHQPVVMGILNITPDSFFGGSRLTSITDVLKAAETMIRAGALILDVGGQSTRPGSERISAQQEWNRIHEAVIAIKAQFPEVWLSIDTYYSEVAIQGIAAGADIINDVSFGEDDEDMFEKLACLDITYIGMHKKGNPATMQQHTQYEDVVEDVFHYLTTQKMVAETHGLRNVWVDPGFGFGKSLEQNYHLLDRLDLLQKITPEIMIGVSRKSMIYKLLEVTPEEALNGTTFLHALALDRGAKILRVHDVKEAVECVAMFNQLRP